MGHLVTVATCSLNQWALDVSSATVLPALVSPVMLDSWSVNDQLARR